MSSKEEETAVVPLDNPVVPPEAELAEKFAGFSVDPNEDPTLHRYLSMVGFDQAILLG
jgi:hypothetical protein